MEVQCHSTFIAYPVVEGYFFFSIWMRFIHKLSKTGSIYVIVCACVIKGYLDTQVNQWLETDLNCKYFETYLQCYVYVFTSLLRIVNILSPYTVYLEIVRYFQCLLVLQSHFPIFDESQLHHFASSVPYGFFYLSLALFLFISIQKVWFLYPCDFCIHNLTHSCAIHNEP